MLTWRKSFWVNRTTSFFILLGVCLISPLDSGRGKLVERKSACPLIQRTSCYAHSLRIPIFSCTYKFGLKGTVVVTKLFIFLCLGMNPAQRFKSFKCRMLRYKFRQIYILECSSLRYNDQTSYFTDRRNILRSYPIHKGSNLNSKITDANELLKDIFWKDISYSFFTYLIRINKNLFGP